MTSLITRITLLFSIFILLGSIVYFVEPKLLLETDLGEVQTLGLEASNTKLRETKFQITTNHDPIYIDGDTNFTITATNEGWPGTGTVNDPFLIENYSITTDGSTAISINNTQVYFQIKNCEINSTALMLNTGYQLVNVSHGTLMNNTATSFYYAISLTNSSFNRIEGNTFATTIAIFGVGFNLRGSDENILSNNVVDSFRWGFRVSYSNSNILTHNIINNCSEEAFNLNHSNWNHLSANFIKDSQVGFYIRNSDSNNVNKSTVINSNSAIFLLNSFYNYLTTNNISNSVDGIRMENSSRNVYTHNVVFNQTHGFSLESNCSYNRFSWNTVIDSDSNSFYLHSGSFNNITWNTFLTSREGGISYSQIYNTVSNTGNNITFNHYDDSITPDANHDGFVDLSYNFQGSNSDQFPRVAPIWINENEDFTKFGLKGNGTINDPYIFENNYFKSNKTTLIFIHNTTNNFIIRKTTLDGMNKFYPCVEFSNVTNALLDDVSIINGLYGISLISSSNQNIANSNLITNCTIGFWIDNSTNDILTSNLITNCTIGFRIDNSTNDILTSNLITNCSKYGIVLNPSTSQNEIVNNTFTDNWINALDNSTGPNDWDRNSYGLHPEGIPFQIMGTAQAIDMNPTELDTDNDEIPDWYEIAMGMNRLLTDSEVDLDLDGMANLWEYNMGLNASDPSDALEDTEKDGLTNLQEYNFGSNAKAADSDSDYLPDLYEYQNGLDTTINDSLFDADEDGLSNLQEYLFGSRANMTDSEGDGMPDLFEYSYFLHPLKNDSYFDPDGDGFTNLEEFQNGTNPRVSDAEPQSSTTQPSEISTTHPSSQTTTTQEESTTFPGIILVIPTVSILVLLIRRKKDIVS